MRREQIAARGSIEQRDAQIALSPGPVSLAIMKSGEAAVRERLAEALSPFRSRDGGYRLENHFIFVLADAP